MISARAAGYRKAIVKHSLVFPVAYLSLTSSLTLLLVLVGLSGRGDLAADLALIQGATLATFYALSGNTRSLILQRHAELTPGRIFELRLFSLPILFIAATALCAGAGVPLAFSSLIVARRCAEWLAEVRLCEFEIADDHRGAVRAFSVQIVITLATAYVLIWVPTFTLATLTAYAVSPLAVLNLAYLRREQARGRSRLGVLHSLSPYIGSTIVEGVATYLLRLVVVLIAGRATAGLLFTGYLIGSFAATIFGNVFAPTLALRGSDARVSWPRLLTRVLAVAMVVSGVALCAASLASGVGDWIGRPGLFWLAIGASLVGGSVMVLAQTIRARVFERQRGDVLFGPDVLRNIAIIVAAPALYYLISPPSLAYLYLASSAITLVVYWLTELYIAGERDTQPPRWILATVAALLLFPLFFFINGHLYHAAAALLKTSGSLMSVPLPISLLGCALAIVVLFRYGEAVVGFGVVFALFVALTFASIIVTQGDLADQQRKFLLLFQFLIPALALVLGELFGGSPRIVRLVATAFLCVLAATVPAQLIRSITAHQNEGNFLFHDLWIFSIYQHTEYVATIYVCAYVAALLALWQWPVVRKAQFIFGPLMAAYAAASFSITTIACLVAGAILLLTRWWSDKAARWLAAAMIVTVGAFFVLAKDSALLRAKMETSPDAVAARLADAPAVTMDTDAIMHIPGPLQVRLFYWKLYATHIGDSAQTVLFGHREVIDRTVAPSAHNYYLDFVYNFGAIALLPLLWLVFYTLSMIWRLRTRVWADAGLLGICFVVLFALAIENMVKVPLRQPYPGVFFFFAWGLLIAQLRAKSSPGPASAPS